MKKKIVIIIILLGLICASCVTPSQLILDSPCKLPCWHGIQPGITTFEEALQVIKTLPTINQDSVYIEEISQENGQFDKFVYFTIYKNWPSQAYRNSGNLWLKNNIVIELILLGESGINLSMMINEFGSLNYVHVDMNEGGPYVKIFYPSLGMIFGFRSRSIEQEIRPESQITTIICVDEADYEMLLTSGYFNIGGYSSNLIFYKWDGYGIIKELYWPPSK